MPLVLMVVMNQVGYVMEIGTEFVGAARRDHDSPGDDARGRSGACVGESCGASGEPQRAFAHVSAASRRCASNRTSDHPDQRSGAYKRRHVRGADRRGHGGGIIVECAPWCASICLHQRAVYIDVSAGSAYTSAVSCTLFHGSSRSCLVDACREPLLAERASGGRSVLKDNA